MILRSPEIQRHSRTAVRWSYSIAFCSSQTKMRSTTICSAGTMFRRKPSSRQWFMARFRAFPHNPMSPRFHISVYVPKQKAAGDTSVGLRAVCYLQQETAVSVLRNVPTKGTVGRTHLEFGLGNVSAPNSRDRSWVMLGICRAVEKKRANG